MARDINDRLVVDVGRIPANGLIIDETFPREWLTNIPEFLGDGDTRINGDLKVAGKVTLEGGNLRLKGSIHYLLSTFCTRCGDPTEVPVSGDIELTLIPGEEPELPDGSEIGDDETGSAYFQGERVDLNPYFKEEAAIQIPVQALCRDDCKGLCPKCGANLNRESCSCDKQNGDPRLQVLRGLKLDDDR